MAIPKYSCDFETNTNEYDCRVWAWIAINIANENEKYVGNSIDSFFEWALKLPRKLYFHNLRFDGEFALNWLFRNGFEHTTDKKIKNMQFTTLISDMGQFYTIKVCKGSTTIEFLDSLKIIPSSVDRIAKDFKMPIQKLKLVPDYTVDRPLGHILTENEIAYITNDALIIARALQYLFGQGLKKMTAASNALQDYKNRIGGNKAFRAIFPECKEDEFIRKSYRGGWCYVNPLFQNIEVDSGIVLDVNSLYPSSMHSPNMYPYGEGVYYQGKYIENSEYPLYVQEIYVQFDIKDNHLPTIQIKHSTFFGESDYLTSSNGECVSLVLTSVDLKLFLDHYKVRHLSYVQGYMYKGASGMFDSYIDHWYNTKAKAKKENNGSLYTLAKLMQNSLYGKFAASPSARSKYPFLKEDGSIAYNIGLPEKANAVYLPVGTFCTAYARNTTIRAAQKCYDRFAYADTDSLHLIGLEVPNDLIVDDYKLGAWKHESSFVNAKYLRPKLYMEHIILKETSGIKLVAWDVKGAGMTQKVKDQVTYETFNYGSEFTGKLQPKHVAGGIVLTERPFTIKPKK